jgi:hypothetical protein
VGFLFRDVEREDVPRRRVEEELALPRVERLEEDRRELDGVFRFTIYLSLYIIDKTARIYACLLMQNTPDINPVFMPLMLLFFRTQRYIYRLSNRSRLNHG